MISKEVLDDIIDEAYKVSHTTGYSFIKTRSGWVANPKLNVSENIAGIDQCIEKTEAFLNKILKDDSRFNTIQDYSMVEIGELYYNLQLINDIHELNVSHSLCINISVIAPLFHIHLLELQRKVGNFAKWDGLPQRNIQLEKNQYFDVIGNTTTFLEQELGLFELPENLSNSVIPGAFTEDIEIDTFTYYNAFFLRDYYTR